MGKYIKIFNNHSEYEAFKASEDYITPNVSYCVNENEVHYNPYVPPFFCKLTLNDGSVVKLEGSGELTSAMISNYKSTLVSADIGTQCTSIGGSAFTDCSGLTSVVIPDSVTSIGYAAFMHCRSFTSVTIPNSVTTISGRAFEGCSGFTSVAIPGSVTSIGGQAFLNCSSLSTITSYIMNAPSVNPGTFAVANNGGTLYVPIGSSGYDTWMSNQGNLGYYNWTKIEQ